MSIEKPVSLIKATTPQHTKPNRNAPPALPEVIVPVESTKKQPRQEGLVRRLGRSASQWYHSEDRPSLFEVHLYYLPLAIAIAGGGAKISDEEFGTHFGRDLANVQVIKDSNVAFRTMEQIAQDVGKLAESQDVNVLDDLQRQWDQ